MSDVFDKVRAVARSHGVRWYEDDGWPHFDPRRGHASDLAEDLVHEVAHWLVAHPSRRMVPYFGLGHPHGEFSGDCKRKLNGSYDDDCKARLSGRRAAWEEYRASLLGIALFYDCGGDWVCMFEDHGWAGSTIVVPIVRGLRSKNLASNKAWREILSYHKTTR